MEKKIRFTEKMKKFCDYYIQTGNSTQSAIKAGYSKKTAYSIGNENLSKPEIKAYIDKKIKAKDDKRIMKQDEVLKLLTSLARGQVTEEVVNVMSQPDGAGAYVQNIEITDKNISHKDRIKALELLGKRYRLFDKDVLEEVENKPIILVDDIK